VELFALNSALQTRLINNRKGIDLYFDDFGNDLVYPINYVVYPIVLYTGLYLVKINTCKDVE
jgi:hypothetical protein